MKRFTTIFSIIALSLLVSGCTPDSNSDFQERPDLMEKPDGGKDEGKDDSGDTQPEKPSEDPDKIIKAMSYNIRTGTSDTNTNNKWDNRKKASPAMIKDMKPTVFGLQEALYFQVSYLNDNLPDYDFYGVGRETGKEGGNSSVGGDEIMAIFYNKNEVTMGDHGTFWLAEGAPTTPVKGWDASYKRTATWAMFTHKKTGKKFLYVNTHYDHKGNLARENSSKLLVEQFKKLNPENYPVILTGDFNLEFSSNLLLPLKNAMNDARTTADKTSHAATFNSWGSKSQIIDHIFYKGLKAWRYQVVNTKYENVPYISDHYPIMATFQFEE